MKRTFLELVSKSGFGKGTASDVPQESAKMRASAPEGRFSELSKALLKPALLILAISMALAVAAAQQNKHDMSGMPMPDHDMSQTQTQDLSSPEGDTSAHAMHSMEDHHMAMGPHMKMTALRTPQPGDEEKAGQIVETARKVMEKYQDYHAALNDGFKIFHPNLPQKQYHFTNNRYAFEAAFRFNPEHPTSLLYERHGDGYKLIGVMYTAPKRYTEDDLNQRIPLSTAQWHEHVNFCAPPQGSKPDKRDLWGPKARFGLAGSIATQEECNANRGRFYPVIFNWMVHVYPLEKDTAQIWSVERQAHHHGGD
jgi:hypothetical protein